MNSVTIDISPSPSFCMEQTKTYLSFLRKNVVGVFFIVDVDNMFVHLSADVDRQNDEGEDTRNEEKLR